MRRPDHRAVLPRRRRGAAAVEFAMTLPVMAFLLIGIIEYSWFMSQRAMVESAAGDVARYAATQPTGTQLAAASATGAVLLEDLGFDCDALDCTIATQTVTVDAIDAIEVRLQVQFDQLTNAFPAGSSGLGLLMPDNLIGQATVPLNPPL